MENSSPPVKVQRLISQLTVRSPVKVSRQGTGNAEDNEDVPDIIGQKVHYIKSILNLPKPLISLAEIFSD